MSQQPTESVELSGQESHSLRDYISSHHTTVLTVMFTDIKGYTQLTEEKGEAYVADMRKAHDELLTGIIEHDHSGLIIKHIGDSVMAVFAEPSRAVDRALQIQQQLVTFNQRNPQWDDIEVRIGLHMGQVTVEGEVTFDIFGRHVNRAARIEALADGGQIYMSYTVFDSARSWLIHQNDFGWQSHGRYPLKGISEPVELFEVWDKSLRQPAAPKKVKPVRQKPRALYLAAALIAGIGLTLAAKQFSATELRLKAPYPQTLYTRNWQKVELEGDREDPQRKAALDLSPGRYPLFHLIAENTVRFSQIELQRGDNLISPAFKNYQLPAFYIRQQASEPARQSRKHQLWSYQAVNAEGKLQDYQAEATLELDSQLKMGQMVHLVRWQLSPAPSANENSSKESYSGERSFSRLSNQSGSVHQEEVLARFDRQKLVLKASLVGEYIQLRLNLEYQ